jgi:glycopeptide antibiotics resistance protein
MKVMLKKLLVLLPGVALTIFYLGVHWREDYRHLGAGRSLLFLFTLVVLYGWMLLTVLGWKQKNGLIMIVQSSFLVYIFMVLTLTGYFILFREISAHGWWSGMRLRVEREDHVNLTPFQVFKIYRLTDKQIVGNFIMLFPLGIYLPILYKRLNKFWRVFLVSLLVSVSIEILQLATRFRSADIDDVILNTTGALIGYLFFKLIASFKPRAEAHTSRIKVP